MFPIYVLFLIFSGIAMLVMARIKNGQPTTQRVLNAIFGAGFTIYGLYLLLIFRGGHYLLFFYAFILPVIMIIRFLRDGSAFRARRQAAAIPAPPAGYAAPSGYGKPDAPDVPGGSGDPAG